MCLYGSFFADYKTQTTRELNVSPTIFGQQTASNYSTLPASQRRFYYNAVLPCFDEIKNSKTYANNHYKNALVYYDIAYNYSEIIKLRARLAEVTGNAYDPGSVESPFVIVNKFDQAKLLSSFFTPTLDVKDVPAELSPADPQKLLALIEQETKPSDGKMKDDIMLLETEFARLADLTATRHQEALARNKALQISTLPAVKP